MSVVGLGVVAAFLGAANAAAQNRLIGPKVTPVPVTGDHNRQKVDPNAPPREIPEGRPEREPKGGQARSNIAPDNSAQVAAGPSARVSTVVSAAADAVVAGQLSNAFPPDTVGDVGPNHYVQMVNATTYQVFSKTGAALTPPLNFGALWPSGACQSNLGDPIVVYDHLADRWLLSQFAQDAAGAYMCMAVSRTANPVTNTWFLYQFGVPVFPDYPKIAVWPSGYFLSSYEGVTLGVYAFDRARMLVGQPANFIRFAIDSLQGTVRDTRILPADLDGPAPSPGTPNYFIRTVDDAQDSGDPRDRIEIWAFQVDFNNQFSSLFLPVQTITTSQGLAPFNTMHCNRNGGGIRDCIPQPGTTNTLDALSNRPMMQLRFRDFGTHQVLLFNQTVEASTSIPSFVPQKEVAGIRWYELRRANFSPWGIFQQGTYAAQDPGGPANESRILHRWMGSMAMNGAGDIALGYSIVNSSNTAGTQVFPGLRYTGRLSTDPAGLLWVPEVILAPGTNSQTVTQRWGDYSAMSVDPVDDCTFWFTSHLAPVGAGPHPTRIASFRLSDCSIQPKADLRLSMTAAPAAEAGGQVTYSILVENNSGTAATGVVTTLPLPANTTLAGVNAPGWNCAVNPPGTVRCTRPSLDPLASSAIGITLAIGCATPNGATLSATASVTASTPDPNLGNNSSTVVTQAANAAPTVSTVTVDLPILLPADGRLVDVNLAYSASDTCGGVTCTITVTASEPATPGVDWVVVNSHQVRLRATSGGNGRIYNLTVTCVDAAGNSTQRSVFVIVPKA